MIALALIIAVLWIAAAFLWLADGSTTSMAANIALADDEVILSTPSSNHNRTRTRLAA